MLQHAKNKSNTGALWGTRPSKYSPKNQLLPVVEDNPGTNTLTIED